jgi:hypothetical protein
MKIVYVIYNHTNHCVKVGYTVNLNSRFSQIQLSTADKLTLLFTLSGGVEIESEIHKLLAKYRLRGEWFAYNQEVLSLLMNYQQNFINGLTFTEKEDETLAYKISLICEDYLADYKTKPKTRVPLKLVRESCPEPNISTKQLRFIMSKLGYHELKDANKSVFFIKVGE